jgi:hypothetical protein
LTQWNQGCRISDSDLQIFEIELRLKNRSRWEWLVRTRDGRTMLFGHEASRTAASYEANRALFLLLSSAKRGVGP